MFRRRSSNRSKSALSAISSRSSAESLTSRMSSFSNALIKGNRNRAVTIRTAELIIAISTGLTRICMNGKEKTAFSA